jgi:hypothetical protein
MKIKSALGCLTLLIFAVPASEGAGRAAPYFAFHNNFLDEPSSSAVP